MSTVAELLIEAVGFHRAGDFPSAERLYGEILHRAPGNPDGLHLLGLLCGATNRRAEATTHLRKAAQALPSNPAFWLDLGDSLDTEGRRDDALDAYARALRLKPNHVPALMARAGTLRRGGDLRAAAEDYARAVVAAPDSAAGHANLGAALLGLGDYERAEFHLREALRLDPNSVEACVNLASTLFSVNKPAKAIAPLEKFAAAVPAIPEIHESLGVAYMRTGNDKRAEPALRIALGLRPHDADTLTNLGCLLARTKRYAEAQEALVAALRINPRSLDALLNLGVMMRETNNLDEAVSCYEKMLAVNPDSVAGLTNLAETLQVIGEIDHAEELLRRALVIDPDSTLARSNLLACLNYSTRSSPQDLLAEHVAWGNRVASPGTFASGHVNPPDPDRPLRIGYVSPDFCNHPVAAFLFPLLSAHDKRAVEVVCYAASDQHDDHTHRFQALGHQWLEVTGLSDDRLAAKVIEDRIDILVDCAGHTFGNRLSVFARRPAPVQVTYLGYPNTTGLSAIDVRFTDGVADPPGEADCHTEKLVRLSPGFFAYDPPTVAPHVNVLPAERIGHVTFGSLHNLARLNAAVIELWCRILAALPSSRLLIFRTALSPRAQSRIGGLISSQGIDPARVEYRRQAPPSGNHLELYHEIDIALDTSPWSGHTTACESLWMGVPVVTLRGDRHAGRMVASLLTMLGRQGWIADSPEEYLRVATDLAADLDRLAGVREGLRECLRQSPACDGASLTRSVEGAYRVMWREWCARRALM